ncbi:MAG: hypothetical protein V4662_24870 [Verrucomicrobiota bacterium]
MESPIKFRVFTDDNFHYMDESERRNSGGFDTYEAALEKAKYIVETCLEEFMKPGISAGDLMAQYVMFGDDPWIKPTPEGVERFSARDYARRRCVEICGGS